MVSRRSRGGWRSQISRLVDRRLLVVGAVLVMWISIVVLAAGAPPSDGHWVGIPSLETAFAIFSLVLMGTGLVLLVLMVVLRTKGGAQASARKPVWPLMVLVLFIIVLSSRLPRAEDKPGEAGPSATVSPESGGGGAGRSPVVTTSELTMVLIILLASAAAVGWTRRRLGSASSSDEGTKESIEEALAPIVDQAANQLELGDDPRSAVLLAYAGVEGALAELGHPPWRSETSTEYLARILAEVPVDPVPLVDLARLYELARFSGHPISQADKDGAAAALRQVRIELSHVG